MRWRIEFQTFLTDMAAIVKSSNHIADEHANGRLKDLRGLATATMVYQGYDDGLMRLEAELHHQHGPKRSPPPPGAGK
jgi:hypothetical protein